MTYDCFMLFNELDLLEMRLNILDPYIDFFVIGESTETFSGKSKPLNYLINRNRFKKWHHKIIYKVIAAKDFKSAFDRAHFQKESLMEELWKADIHDVVYFGDLDEIWTPQIVVHGEISKLKQLNYCYYLNQRSSEEWIGTIVGLYGAIREKGFNWNRANPSHFKDNGGWHFTNMGGAEQIIKKIDAYDHQEFNTETTKALLMDRMKDEEDYVGRSLDWQGKPFEFWLDESDLPKYLLDNKEKYANFFK